MNERERVADVASGLTVEKIYAAYPHRWSTFRGDLRAILAALQPAADRAVDDSCAHCGAADPDFIKTDDKAHPYVIRCRECGCSTAHHGDWNAVWSSWRKRPASIRALSSPETASEKGEQTGQFTIADEEGGFVGLTVTMGGNVYIQQRDPEGEDGDTSQITLSRRQFSQLAALAPTTDAAGGVE